MYGMIGDAYAYVATMEVDLARMRPMEAKLTTMKENHMIRDAQEASLEQIVKSLQDRLTMSPLD